MEEKHEVFFTAQEGNLLEIVENTVHIPAVGVDGEFSETAKTLQTQFFGLFDTSMRPKVKTGQRQKTVGEPCGGIEYIIVVACKQFSGSPRKPEDNRAVYPVFIHRLDEHFRSCHFRIRGTV
jgi:hypothetical protein